MGDWRKLRLKNGGRDLLVNLDAVEIIREAQVEEGGPGLLVFFRTDGTHRTNAMLFDATWDDLRP